MDTDKRVCVQIHPNQGYGAYQVDGPMTLGDLASLIAMAIEEYGPDALVVTDNGSQYGARFGSFDKYAPVEVASFRPGDDDE